VTAAPEIDPAADIVLSPRALRWQRRRESWGRIATQFGQHRAGMSGLAILSLFVLMALTAGILFPRSMLDIAQTTHNPAWHPPDAQFWLGTDKNGRSVLAELFWGSRTSLAVGLAATFVAAIIGAAVGIASGHYRNGIGMALERFTDWFLVIPWLPLAVVILTLLGGGLGVIILVIGVTSWAGTARLLRAQTLSIEGRPYMERAKVLGVGDTQQMTRHVLPNVLPLILANATLTVSIAILTETTLSFLGLGDPAHPSWGTMLEDAFNNSAISNGAWWWVLPPGVCIVLVVLSFTLIGRALEVIFNPRLSQELP
jgi:peptide/nickel transport system permease protein